MSGRAGYFDGLDESSEGTLPPDRDVEFLIKHLLKSSGCVGHVVINDTRAKLYARKVNPC